MNGHQPFPPLQEFLKYARDSLTSVRGKVKIETISGYKSVFYALTERKILAIDPANIDKEDLDRALDKIYRHPKIPPHSAPVFVRIEL